MAVIRIPMRNVSYSNAQRFVLQYATSLSGDVAWKTSSKIQNAKKQ
jgi:hypothetical protein